MPTRTRRTTIPQSQLVDVVSSVDDCGLLSQAQALAPSNATTDVQRPLATQKSFFRVTLIRWSRIKFRWSRVSVCFGTTTTTTTFYQQLPLRCLCGPQDSVMDVLRAVQTYVTKMVTQTGGIKVLLLDQDTVRLVGSLCCLRSF